MDAEILQELETMEAIHFLTLSLEDKIEKISALRAAFPSFPPEEKAALLEGLRSDNRMLREYYGAIPTDAQLREMLRLIRSQSACIYLSRFHIDRVLFTRYGRVVPDWAQHWQHGQIVLDGKDNRSVVRFYTPANALWWDVTYPRKKSQEYHGGTNDFRQRPSDYQGLLHTHLRSLVSAIFNFLEAYLNGLAYDCFVVYHDTLPIDDHDTLAEWDSRRRKRKYVSFDRKLFEYPKIVARSEGKACDLSGFGPAHFLARDGKDIRDALTHPSPYIDPTTTDYKKTMLFVSLHLPAVEKVVEAAKEYVLKVESDLGHDPKVTVGYLLKDAE